MRNPRRTLRTSREHVFSGDSGEIKRPGWTAISSSSMKTEF